jgi:hypothetical protein
MIIVIHLNNSRILIQSSYPLISFFPQQPCDADRIGLLSWWMFLADLQWCFLEYLENTGNEDCLLGIKLWSQYIIGQSRAMQSHLKGGSPAYKTWLSMPLNALTYLKKDCTLLTHHGSPEGREPHVQLLSWQKAQPLCVSCSSGQARFGKVLSVTDCIKADW